MDFKKCCSCVFWGGIIVYLHLKLNGEKIDNAIDKTIKKIKPKIEDTIDNLKK